MDQIERQLGAVGGDGTKIRWEVSTLLGADGIRDLFADRAGSIPGLVDIKVVHDAQQTIL